MKIISGVLKGRKLKGYQLEGTRPTMDRIKESLFAMIQEKIQNSICLDLFAGSGNLGIEAISQGAKFVYFNDFNKKAFQKIGENINDFQIQNDTKILNFSYQKALSFLKDKKLDIIFLDPPYDTDYIQKSIQLIEKYELLNQDGVIICESNEFNKIKYSSHFIPIKEKKYKDKWVVIIKKV